MADQQHLADPAPAQPKGKKGQAKVKQGAASEDGASKKGKKKQQAAADSQEKTQQDPALAPEAAARQLMQNFLGN